MLQNSFLCQLEVIINDSYLSISIRLGHMTMVFQGSILDTVNATNS